MVICKNCGQQFDEKKYFRICPKCGTFQRKFKTVEAANAVMEDIAPKEDAMSSFGAAIKVLPWALGFLTIAVIVGAYTKFNIDRTRRYQQARTVAFEVMTQNSGESVALDETNATAGALSEVQLSEKLAVNIPNGEKLMLLPVTFSRKVSAADSDVYQPRYLDEYDYATPYLHCVTEDVYKKNINVHLLTKEMLKELNLVSEEIISYDLYLDMVGDETQLYLLYLVPQQESAYELVWEHFIWADGEDRYHTIYEDERSVDRRVIVGLEVADE
ncbi:MAG: hypothetical protein K6G23_10940 [Lachnospiraceae bacterium]|nr:hypothetical protein [Lachnospiraceae bacterium]